MSSVSRIEPRLAVAVLAALPDALFVLRADGVIAASNPTAARLCGVPEALAAGRPWGEVLRLQGDTDNAVLGQLIEELRYDAHAVGTRVLVREDDTVLLGPQGATSVDIHLLAGLVDGEQAGCIILLLRETAAPARAPGTSPEAPGGRGRSGALAG